MFRERIELLLDSISDSSDVEYSDTVQELIESAAEYMKRVVVLEAARSTAKHKMEGEEYREYIQQLDSSRSSAHNKLISNVKLVNRLCKQNGTPSVFEGDEDKRIEIADFAQLMMDEYFSTRIL